MQGKPTQQLKKFNFFTAQPVSQKISDPRSHPIRLTELRVTAIVQAKSKVLLLQEPTNRVLVFGKAVESQWVPHTQATWRIAATTLPHNEVVITYGQDAEQQAKSVYIKLWTFDQDITDWQKLKARRSLLIGKLGQPENIVTCMHMLNDCSALVAGTRRGGLLLFQCRNLLQQDSKHTNRGTDKKPVQWACLVKRGAQTDLYIANDDSFLWYENMGEKKRIVQSEVQMLEAGKQGSVLVCFKGDPMVYEYRGGVQVRSVCSQGQKRRVDSVKQFRGNYLVMVSFEGRNQKNEKSTDKHFVQIIDTVNQYIAYFEAFPKVQAVLPGDQGVALVVLTQKGQRLVLLLTEKDNSFKIQTFFKRSFFNQAWRFAKNQNCQQSLLAQISRLHGDLLYSKSDFAGAIGQYIMTIGTVQPSYVIRKFLDVSQIDFLIQYLQKIHEKKLARKQHTALLLNCYVKKQKIDSLSQFLSQSSLQSDLFDIQTAIKVCKDLSHFDAAMRLAEQKNKHELYLKILIQNKKQHDKALEYIRTRVPLEQKEKFLIQFGQDFMRYQTARTVELIKLLIRAHSISQIVRGKQRDYVLTPDQRRVFQQLHFDSDELQSLTVITFKKPDEFFRLFMTHNDELQQLLLYLINQVPKLPHEQIVFHRLIQFYLQMGKQHPSRRQEYAQNVIALFKNPNKKFDNNVLLSLFRIYDFDQGLVELCRQLDMRQDLINFFIARNRDKQIMQLCRAHGSYQINLWITALKYFVKPELRKQYYVPQILQQLGKIPNLAPLPVLNILQKSKNIQYKFVKRFFLQKLKQDRYNIQKDRQVVLKNTRKAADSRQQFKKLKTTAKPFLSNNCAHCQNGLTFPSIYFMCGHAYHENCLGGERECPKCRFDMRAIIERKERYQEGSKDQAKLFETLQQRKESGFQVISQFLGKGLFASK